jgi:hypothetical protein
MKSDLVPHARQALGDVKPAVAFDPAKGKELLARADVALGTPPAKPLASASVSAPPSAQPQPRVEQVKVPMMCSARGVPFVVIAERRGDELRFVGHEMPQPGPDGAPPRLPGRLSGQYRIDRTGWTCPCCSNGEGVWLCDCEEMKGAMHCHGTSGGRYRCACGRHEEREFQWVKAVEVRGASVAATPEQTRSSSHSGPSKFKQVSYDKPHR